MAPKKLKHVLLGYTAILLCQTALSQNDSSKSNIKIENFGSGINSPLDEFAPIINTEDKLFFSKEKTNGAFVPVIGKDIYFSYLDSLDPKITKHSILSNFTKTFGKFHEHDAILALFSEDSLIYTSKNDKIYYSKLKNDTWSDLKSLCSDIKLSIYKNHFTITRDRKTIYFSAKDKYGYGGYDIYSANLLANSKWSVPQNIGHFINTAGDELSPEISRDGKTLYFSSNGHKGLGGFDIYKVYLIKKHWTTPVNLSAPINSSANEIFMRVSSDEQYAVYSSNRDGGNGGYDIYKISSSGISSKPTGIIDFGKDSISSDFPSVTSSQPSCSTFENKDFLVSLDASRSIDTAGKKINIEWVFDDGKKEMGIKTQHGFKTPGKHLVSINAIDPSNNKMELGDAVQEINIEGLDYVGFICKDTTSIGNPIIFDGSYSFIKGKKITKYSWMINGNTLDLDSSKPSKTFDAEGMYKVEMIIYTEDKLIYCWAKTVFIKEK